MNWIHGCFQSMISSEKLQHPYIHQKQRQQCPVSSKFRFYFGTFNKMVNFGWITVVLSQESVVCLCFSTTHMIAITLLLSDSKNSFVTQNNANRHSQYPIAWSVFIFWYSLYTLSTAARINRKISLTSFLSLSLFLHRLFFHSYTYIGTIGNEHRTNLNRIHFIVRMSLVKIKLCFSVVVSV